MKSTLSLLFSAIIFSLFLFMGCSNQDITKEKRLEFLNKTTLKNQTTIYKYKFNFNGNAWMDISAYVKKENLNYIISINEPVENNLNTNTYSPDLDEQNLEISNRVRRETASGLEEAIEKSIFFYLSDNI